MSKAGALTPHGRRVQANAWAATRVNYFFVFKLMRFMAMP
jgi:hypothetical protein